MRPCKPATSMDWYWLNFTEEDSKAHITNHMVSDEYKLLVIDDLRSRFNIKEVKETLHTAKDEFCMDYPGIMSCGRPYEKIVVDGLTIEIACENVCLFLMNWSTWKARTFTNGEHKYYKVHCYPYRAVVLNPKQYKYVGAKLKELAESAEKKSEEFYKSNLLPSEMLVKAANFKPGETSLDLGGHQLDRFKGIKGREVTQIK
jgi:hypothetical protein